MRSRVSKSLLLLLKIATSFVMLARYLQKFPFFSRFLTVLVLGISVFSGDALEAQPVPDIVPDRTLGDESSRVDRVNATRDRITGGATRGANLFHSFEKFDVREGRAAYFANPDAITTIFSRVTGSERSEIFGTLGVEGDANLFFINPSGIIFGPNATLDVRGAFVASTANSIAFPNGENFSATNPDATPLLTIDVPVPIGLRFEGSNSGIIINQADLKAGGNFALIGAAIRNNGQISAPGGDITLATVPGAINSVVRLEKTGEYIGQNQGIGQPKLTGRNITLTGGTIDASSNRTGGNVTFDSAGNVSFSNATFVDVRGANRGNIAISGQNVDIAGGSQLLAGIREGAGFRGANAGDVKLEVAENVVLRETSRIENRVNENAIGNAGDIKIQAGSLGVFEGSVISASTFGRGNGGDITIVADGTVAIDGLGDNVSAIATTVDESAVGNAGDINIKSQSFSQTGDTQLGTFVLGASDSLSGGKGNAGDVTIQVEDDLTIAGFDEFFIPVVSFIFADVSPGARGNAGNIDLKAGGAVNLGESVRFFAGNGGIGNSGNINLQAESVSLIDGVQLVAGNDGGGNAGDIEIQAKETLNITGFDNFGNPSGLFSSISDGKFNAGNIDLQAGSITLNNFAQLNTSNLGQGNAGNISIEAKDRVSIFNNSLMASNMEGSDAIGNVGTIAIKSGSVSLNNSSQLQASSRDGAQATRAGVISINATESVSLVGNSKGNPTAIFTNVEAGGMGNSGEIKISAPSISLSDNARLSTSNAGVSNAGKIALRVGSLSLSGSQLAANNTGRGNAGEISIKASDRVSLNNSFISGSLIGSEVIGNVGRIAIEAGSVELNNNSQLQTSVSSGARSTQAGQISVKATDSVSLAGSNTSIFSNVNPGGIGNSSNIFVSAPSVSIAEGARLDTSNATGGNGGNITVRAKDSLTVTGFNSSGDSSRIITQAGQGNAGMIELQAGSITISDRAIVQAANTGRGSTGNILLRAKDNISVSNSRISTNLGLVDGSNVTGNIGTISLEAASISFTNGSDLLSRVLSGARATKAGQISVRATDSVSLAGSQTRFSGSVLPGGVGNGSQINVSASSVSLSDGALLISNNFGTGNAGNVKVQARENITISGSDSSGISSGISISARQGNSGKIDLQASSISLSDRAILQAINSQQGSAGDILLKASNRVSLNNSFLISNLGLGDGTDTTGNVGTIEIEAGEISLTNGAQLQAAVLSGAQARQTGQISIKANDSISLAGRTTGIITSVEPEAVGNSSNIFIWARSFSLTDGAFIFAETSGQGSAGNIQVNVRDNVNISGTITGTADGITRIAPSIISSSVFSTRRGKGGTVNINADSLSLDNLAVISTSTFGRGNAGNILIRVDDLIRLTNVSSVESRVARGGIGTGGDINIQPRSLNSANRMKVILENGSRISVSNLGTGVGGQIGIEANNLTLNRESSIAAITSSNQGGNIDLNIQDLLSLRNGSQISATAGLAQAGGDGGNIDINARTIFAVPQENSDITANAFRGDGGRVTINTESIFGIDFRDRLTPLSDITASSERGVAGEVIINTSGVEPTRGLESLTEERVNVEVAQGCQVGTAQGGRVSFYNVGRAGLPPSPEDLIDSPIQGEWLSLESEEDTSIKPETQRNVFKTQANNSILTFSCSARVER
jgi:filamentous hemagglutinin family protein